MLVVWGEGGLETRRLIWNLACRKQWEAEGGGVRAVVERSNIFKSATDVTQVMQDDTCLIPADVLAFIAAAGGCLVLPEMLAAVRMHSHLSGQCSPLAVVADKCCSG